MFQLVEDYNVKQIFRIILGALLVTQLPQDIECNNSLSHA